MARAAANAAHCAFISLDGASVYSPYVGDAEASLREAFRKARAGMFIVSSKNIHF